MVKKEVAPPPPKIVPRANLKEIEYYQGPTYNRFVLILDRAPADMSVSSSSNPPSVSIYLDKTNARTERPQLFLNFTWVKSVIVEEVQEATRVTFLATANYLPEPDIDREGGAITVAFIVKD